MWTTAGTPPDESRDILGARGSRCRSIGTGSAFLGCYNTNKTERNVYLEQDKRLDDQRCSWEYPSGSCARGNRQNATARIQNYPLSG